MPKAQSEANPLPKLTTYHFPCLNTCIAFYLTPTFRLSFLSLLSRRGKTTLAIRKNNRLSKQPPSHHLQLSTLVKKQMYASRWAGVGLIGSSVSWVALQQIHKYVNGTPDRRCCGSPSQRKGAFQWLRLIRKTRTAYSYSVSHETWLCRIWLN